MKLARDCRFLVYAMCLASAVFLSGCADGWNPISGGRGSVIDYEEIPVMMPDQLQDRLEKIDPNLVASTKTQGLIQQNGSSFYPIQFIKLRYRSADVRGNPLELSGLLIQPIPLNVLNWFQRRPLAVPLVGLQHGTLLERAKAPSMDQSDPQVLVGMLLAVKGYAVAMADYPGLGADTVSTHPYCHARSLALSVVDMLRAARQYLHERQSRIVLNGQLFLLGYSEGGYATLSAVKEIRQQCPDEFNLVAACPMAGSYDLSGTMKDVMLSSKPYDEPYFLPYIILGYQAVYGDPIAPQNTLKQPLADLIPPLMDGYHGLDEVNRILPISKVPRDMLLDSAVEGLQDQTGEIYAFLQENDLWAGWTPDVPIRLYHSPGDNLVPFENSVKTFSEFSRRGAPVELIELAPATHEQAAAEAFIKAFLWIDSLRE